MEKQRSVFIQGIDEFAKQLELSDIQKLKLDLLASKAEAEGVKAVIKIKAEDHHTIDVSMFGAGYARVTLPKEILSRYRAKSISFEARLISDKMQLLGFFYGGLLDNISEPVIIMIPRESGGET